MTLLRQKNGAIFVDVMLGIYLLAILGLMFAATTMAAVNSRAAADERTKATIVVNRQIESMRTLGYGNLTYDALRFYNLIGSSPSSQPYSFTNIGATNNKVSDLLPSGEGTVTIADLSSTMRQVTVTVTWETRTGAKSVSASTKLAKLN